MNAYMSTTTYFPPSVLKGATYISYIIRESIEYINNSHKGIILALLLKS